MESSSFNDESSDRASSYDLWQIYLARGGTVKDIRKLGQGQMEAMYSLGYTRFDTGLFQDALKVFRYLALLDHWNPRYFLGIGLCLYKMGHYAEAIPSLSYTERLDKKDPRPSICMTECFISLKSRRLAKKSLAEAVKRLKSSDGWEYERRQARQLRHYLLEQAGRG